MPDENEVAEQDLPPGWTVKRDFIVGVTAYNEQGVPRLQHPRLSRALVVMCWKAYRHDQEAVCNG